jgi:hypothetical protein
MKIAIVCLALAAGPAHAYFKDGNKLLSELNSNSGSNVLPATGLGYITGVADALYGITNCPPENVTAGQIRDMVRNYLENTPAVRHLPANQVVSHVLKSVWPCPATNSGGRPL